MFKVIIVLATFIIFNFIISAFSFWNSKKYRQKSMRAITIISLVTSTFVLVIIVAWMINRFKMIRYLRIDYLCFILAGFSLINLDLCIVNIVFLIIARKNKTLPSNKISKPSSVCPKCGLPISKNKKFCTNCGEKLNTI